MLSGIVGSVSPAKIFYSEDLVYMRNSRQVDVRLNGARVALPLYVTDEMGFILTTISYLHTHDMVVSHRHDWIPPREGYGKPLTTTGGIKSFMTTVYRFGPPRIDLKPGSVLAVLKTGQGTTRVAVYVWWTQDGKIAHTAYNTHIINTTAVAGITSDSLAASMGSKNVAVDVFALGFVVTLSFLKKKTTL